MGERTDTRRAGPTDRWTVLRPHPQQWALVTSPARFVAVPAGRRSGKTELAKRLLVRSLPVAKPWPNPRYFFGGPTHDQAKRIAWQDLLDLIPDRWVPGGKRGPNVSHGELWIRCHFPAPDRIATLWVVGLDNPSRIEGTPWDGCVLDESCDLRPGVFSRSVRPALADHAGWCWRIGVPKRTGPGAPEYREFCEECQAGNYPDGAHFTWPSADILPATEIDHARETLDPRDFREQYEAAWETVSGQIFHAFSRDYSVRPCPYDPGRPVVVGCDFNVDPMCWVIGHRYQDRVEWFDELWLRNTNTQAALDSLHAKYGSHRGGFEFYGDAAGRARKTSATSTDYLLIANDPRFTALRRTIHFPDANPPVADRFASCNALFCNARGDRRMFVSPNCKRLIRDLEIRGYRPGSREPADTGDVGHITDAMGYVIHKLFPIRLDIGGSTQQNRVVITTGR